MLNPSRFVADGLVPCLHPAHPAPLSAHEAGLALELAISQMLKFYENIEKICPGVEMHFLSSSPLQRCYTFGGKHEE